MKSADPRAFPNRKQPKFSAFALFLVSRTQYRHHNNNSRTLIQPLLLHLKPETMLGYTRPAIMMKARAPHTPKHDIQQMNGWKKQLFAPDEAKPAHGQHFKLYLHTRICVGAFCVCIVPERTLPEHRTQKVDTKPFEWWMLSKRKIISSSHDLPQTIFCCLNVSYAKQLANECGGL